VSSPHRWKAQPHPSQLVRQTPNHNTRTSASAVKYWRCGGVNAQALRCLHQQGVLENIKRRGCGASADKIELFMIYSDAHLGQIDLAGPSGRGVGHSPFKGLRVMRSDLLQSLLESVQALPNISLLYGR